MENVSFGLTICAERTALFSAVAAGHRTFIAMAVVAGRGGPPSPCGACRQVLAEFVGPDFPVYVASADGLDGYRTVPFGELLPMPFRWTGAGSRTDGGADE